ncbi:MAG: response regulator [Planctomycetaceae bacterium]|nr:response regulator [Planctomycetaceae bacterium]
MRIVILEDNMDRRAAMTDVLEDLFPGAAVEYFAVARTMIEHLDSTGLFDIALISLDNDLDMVASHDGRMADAGDGIEVAEWLVTRPAVVPVLVHTTNSEAGHKIEELLGSNGWTYSRVVPYGGETWISEVWRSTVRTLIVAHSPDTSVSSVGVTVLKHGIQEGLQLEVMLEGILRVVAAHSRGGEEFSFELAYLSDTDVLSSLVSVGKPMLAEIGPGATAEALELSQCCLGIGPVAADSETLEPILRQLLKRIGIKEIQFDVVQPKHGHQAVLLSGNRSSQLDLSSPKVQADIRAVKSLLELALLIELRGPRKDIDVNQQSGIWSP